MWYSSLGWIWEVGYFCINVLNMRAKRLLFDRISKFVGVRGITIGGFVGRDMSRRSGYGVGLVMGVAVVTVLA